MADDRIIEHVVGDQTFRYYESATSKCYSHFDCERRLSAAQTNLYRWFSRTIKTRTSASGAPADSYDIERLRWIADELAGYAEGIHRELDRLEGVDRRAERIRALRAIEGRTPEEAAAFLAKADQLERNHA